MAITDPFAHITFTVVTIAPDSEERILGVARTSLLRLIEQQSTALLERENQEEREIHSDHIDHIHHSTQPLSPLLSPTGTTSGDASSFASSSSTPSSTATKVPPRNSGIRPSGQSLLNLSESLKKSFQQQVVLAQGRGVASIRSAKVLLRGPTVDGLHSNPSSTAAEGAAPSSLSSSDRLLESVEPVVLKVKDKKSKKDVGVLQLRLHYVEKPVDVFIPRPVAYENHDFR